MDAGLIHLIRERYPFPIAHALKRSLALRDDDTQKLKVLIDAAEAVIRFLALVVLAQLHRDLEHQQAPPVGSRGEQLAEDLRNPSFGRWQGILRDVLKCYSAHRHLLMMPELFDFYFKPPRGQRLQVQPVVGQAIDPLIALRNQYHHQPDLPGTRSISKVEDGMRWLEQALGRYLDTTLRRFGREQPQARAVLKALVMAEGTKRASFIEEITSCLQTIGLDWQGDLAGSHQRIGDIVKAQGKPEAALRNYRNSVTHIEPLAQQAPDNSQWQHDLALALNSYALILLTAEPTELRDPAEALTLAKRAAQLLHQMTSTEQATILDTLALAHHRTGEQQRAIEIAEQALLLVPSSANGADELKVRQELEAHLADFRAAQQNNQNRAGSQ